MPFKETTSRLDSVHSNGRNKCDHNLGPIPAFLSQQFNKKVDPFSDSHVSQNRIFIPETIKFVCDLSLT